MDGAGMLWAWFLGIFIIFLLPLITLAAVASAVHYREKTGRWKGRPLKILTVWALFVAGDVPVKLVLLAWPCVFWAEAWVDPGIEFKDRARHFSEQGCGAKCLTRLLDDPQAHEWRDVSLPSAERYAEQAGLFAYRRAPVGTETCIAGWDDALRVHGLKTSTDRGSDASQECLAREVLSDRPDFPTLEVQDDRPKYYGIPPFFFWKVGHFRILNVSTGEDAARFRVYTTAPFWWLPVPISCPQGAGRVSAEMVMRGDYP